MGDFAKMDFYIFIKINTGKWPGIMPRANIIESKIQI